MEMNCPWRSTPPAFRSFADFNILLAFLSLRPYVAFMNIFPNTIVAARQRWLEAVAAQASGKGDPRLLGPAMAVAIDLRAASLAK